MGSSGAPPAPLVPVELDPALPPALDPALPPELDPASPPVLEPALPPVLEPPALLEPPLEVLAPPVPALVVAPPSPASPAEPPTLPASLPSDPFEPEPPPPQALTNAKHKNGTIDPRDRFIGAECSIVLISNSVEFQHPRPCVGFELAEHCCAFTYTYF